jgi:hypothetical protein
MAGSFGGEDAQDILDIAEKGRERNAMGTEQKFSRFCLGCTWLVFFSRCSSISTLHGRTSRCPPK